MKNRACRCVHGPHGCDGLTVRGLAYGGHEVPTLPEEGEKGAPSVATVAPLPCGATRRVRHSILFAVLTLDVDQLIILRIGTRKIVMLFQTLFLIMIRLLVDG